MNFSIGKLKINLKLQAFLGATVILLIYRLIFQTDGSIILSIGSHILFGIMVVFLVIYLNDLLNSEKLNPLNIVMNVGILDAFLFFLITFSGTVFGGFFFDVSGSIQNRGIFNSFFSSIYILINLAAVLYIFLSFRKLYLYKRRKSDSIYYNTMIVFIVLYSLSSILNGNSDFDFIPLTFYIISLVLIGFNSIKISWIAFIVKKDKITLLILSVVLSALFIVNLVNSYTGNVNNQILNNFSPVLAQFLKITMLYGAVYFSVLFFTTLFHIPTAEAYDRKAREVSSLQYFSKLITEVLDIKDLLETITELALKLHGADAAWIAQINDSDVKIISNKNIGLLDSERINKFVLKEDSGNISSAAIFDLNVLRKNSDQNDFYSICIAAPIKTHSDTFGYLIVVKKGSNDFDDEDITAMNTFTDYASVALDNAKLLEASIEKERLEKELDVAREIQRKILPTKNPELPNLSISSVFIPAFEVGGDYYDFFEISEDKFGFVIADVSGKGISAAFIMAEIKGIFESLSKTMENPKEILTKANLILQRTLERKNFVSAAYGVIDFAKSELVLARAGHCPVLLLRDDVAKNIRPSGIGLGLNFTTHFEETLEEIKIDLKDDDIIVLYTDGITEAKNGKLEDFGSRQFERILLENSSENVDSISNKVIREVTLFSQNVSQHDDITLVILKWKQKIKIDGDKEWQSSTPQLKI